MALLKYNVYYGVHWRMEKNSNPYRMSGDAVMFFPLLCCQFEFGIAAATRENSPEENRSSTSGYDPRLAQ